MSPLAVAIDALLTIGVQCTNYTGPATCCDPTNGRTRESPYGAERWCDGCIAHDALVRLVVAARQKSEQPR